MGVYLDNAATTRTKPECVYKAMDRFMREIGASPGRSVHGPGIAASRVIAEARNRAAELFGAPDSSRVVFTLNCTEALNLAIKGVLHQGGRVVTTSVEHNSVMRPLSAAADSLGITIERASCDAAGRTEPESVCSLLEEDTALLVMTHASNVTGMIQPVEECGRMAQERGVPFLLDAAQTAGCLPIDIGQLHVDLLAFSGHKALMGPQGVGGLYVDEGIDLPPLKQGGTGSKSELEQQPIILPDRYESGTPNTPGVAGLGAALDFILTATVEEARAHTINVGSKLLDGLKDIPGARVYGGNTMADNVGVFSFTLDGRDSAVVAAELEEKHEIMTRVGLQCAPAAHKAIGTFPDGTIRASIGHFTTEDEVSALLKALTDQRH